MNIKKYLFAIKLFFSLVWRIPDSKEIPKPYRMGRISISTAYDVAKGWLI